MQWKSYRATRNQFTLLLLVHFEIVLLLNLGTSATTEIPGNDSNTESAPTKEHKDIGDEDEMSAMNRLTAITRALLADEKYDKRLRPNFFTKQLDIVTSLHIQGIFGASELDQELVVDFYIRQSWLDDRLAFDTSGLPKSFEYIPLDAKFKDYIWHPDTYFENEKQSSIHTAIIENSFVRWFPNGTIYHSIRISMRVSCSMNLKNFPLDEQKCSIKASSYGFTDKDVQYKWHPTSSVDFSKESLILLLNFDVDAYKTRTEVVTFSSGNYTTLICDILLRRGSSYYLITIYIPSAMLVIMSWYAFFMDVNEIAERLALSVTTVLTVTTLLVSQSENSPKVSYIKALDIYTWNCFFFVFFAMGESATVGYFCLKRNHNRRKEIRILRRHRRSSRRTGKRQSQISISRSVAKEPETEDSNVDIKSELPSPTIASEVSVDASSQQVDYGPSCFRKFAFCKRLWNGPPETRKYKVIDIASRCAFPSTFLLFNLIYWTYFVYVPKVGDEPDWKTIDASIPRDVA